MLNNVGGWHRLYKCLEEYKADMRKGGNLQTQFVDNSRKKLWTFVPIQYEFHNIASRS